MTFIFDALDIFTARVYIPRNIILERVNRAPFRNTQSDDDGAMFSCDTFTMLAATISMRVV